MIYRLYRPQDPLQRNGQFQIVLQIFAWGEGGARKFEEKIEIDHFLRAWALDLLLPNIIKNKYFWKIMNKNK